MSTSRPEDMKSAAITGIFLMLALSIVLFWLPIIGPLMAGFVGGRKTRRLDLALLVALLPAVFVSLLATFGWHYIPYPLAGILAQGDFAMAILFDGLPLLVGAALGAILP